MKKCFKIFAVLIATLMFASYVFAAEANKDDVTLSVASREECIIKFGQYGEFEKKLVQIDEENKTIDIKLIARNTYNGSTTSEQTTTGELPGEVVLLVDSSNSMNDIVTGTTTRRSLILNATNELVDKLFDLNSNIKIGVVEFSSTTRTETSYAVLGTDNDAKALTSGMVNDKSTVKSAVSSVGNEGMGAYTDLDIGLKTADAMLSASTDSNSKKYLIVLTDGVPNVSEATGNSFEYSPAVTNATTARLTTIKNKGINIVSVLADVSYSDGTSDVVPSSVSKYTDEITHKQIAEEIFGTTTNPKFGPVYYAHGTRVTDTISNTIYETLRTTQTITVDEIAKYTLSDVVIKDFFPQNIVDNFDFSKLSEPQIGTVSDSIDTSDRSITWSIPELKPGQSTEFTYRLSLKDTFDGEIIDLNLPTNEKVTIDYKEGDKPGTPQESTKSPVVKLTKGEPEPEPEPAPDVKKDDPTVAPTPIPRTGSYLWMSVIIATIFGLSVTTYGVIKSIKLSR